MKLGILGSGKGSNFLAIQRAIEAKSLSAQTVVVLSDNPEAGILEHARSFGLPALVLPPSQFKARLNPEIEAQLVQTLRDYEVDLVVLAGYMRIVKEPLLNAFPRRIVNIHPSLLPLFRGLAAWDQALAAGVSESGCTVHWVNAEIDGGETLGQERVPILPGDTGPVLHARIQEAEYRLYPAILNQIVQGKLK